MSGPDQVAGTFDTAVAAFEILFERELDSKWHDLAGTTRDAFIGEGLEIDAHPVEKYHLLWHFCDDASDAIAAVVKKCFPRLLEVATAQREHLGGLSPLSWTEAKILTVVCNFLAMDERFDETSTPRDSSLVLDTAERIITGGRYPDDGPSPEFCLPGWAKMTPRQLIGSLRPDSPVRNSTEPPLSRADTLEWVKWKEWVIRKGLERLISDTSFEASLDSMIEAGKNGTATKVPSMTAPVAANLGKKSTPREMIIFGPPRNGWAVAPERSSCAALKNTNELIEQTLGAIKVVVGQRNGNITADELRELFLDSELYAAAGSNDWGYLIDDTKRGGG
jgi:hypothetical protein